VFQTLQAYLSTLRHGFLPEHCLRGTPLSSVTVFESEKLLFNTPPANVPSGAAIRPADAAATEFAFG